MIQLSLMYPLVLTSMLKSKRSTLIHLEMFIKITHQLSRDLHTSQVLSIWKSFWHLRPPLQRSALSSGSSLRTLILVNPLHLTPPRRRHIGQSSHFIFYLHLGP